MPGIPAADIIGGTLGLAETALGLINSGDTKRKAAELERSRPQYKISPLAGEDLSLAQSELSNGNSAAERAYSTLDNQQFSSSLGAILKGGGNVNNIGELYGNGQEGRLKLTAMRDNLRLNRVNNLFRASEENQQEQQTAWQLNKFAPWEDKAQANAAARTGAQGQIFNGVNTFGTAAINAGNSIEEYNRFFPKSINNNTGFNNGGYATGVPTGDIAPSINNGSVLPMANYNYIR